jgi:hypothetical protein
MPLQVLEGVLKELSFLFSLQDAASAAKVFVASPSLAHSCSSLKSQQRGDRDPEYVESTLPLYR